MIKKWKLFTESLIVKNLVSITTKDVLFDFLNKNKFDYSNISQLNNSIKIIDSGFHGLVFESNGFVYKLTFDKKTYQLCRNLIGKNYEHLIKIYDVEVLHSNIRSLYLIKMEKCYPLPKIISYLFNNLWSEITSYIKNERNFEINIEDNEELLTQHILYLYEEEEISETDLQYIKDINFIEQLKSIKAELIESNIIRFNLDIHSSNVMLKKNDILCLIDFVSPNIIYKKTTK